MMLWLARASRAGWAALAPMAADDDPDALPAGTGAAAGTPARAVPGWLAELAELPCEQPASSRAAPDTRPTHVSAVVRSGPREARARTVGFMPVGRVPPRARFRRSGHGPVTDGWRRPGGTRSDLARAGDTRRGGAWAAP